MARNASLISNDTPKTALKVFAPLNQLAIPAVEHMNVKEVHSAKTAYVIDISKRTKYAQIIMRDVLMVTSVHNLMPERKIVCVLNNIVLKRVNSQRLRIYVNQVNMK